MSNTYEFGDYCLIEQKRFGVENEMYLHKVIAHFRSNCYVKVPVDFCKEEIGKEMVEVVSCICCGVDETLVRKYRVQDIKPNDKFRGGRSINFIDDMVDEDEE